MMEMREWLLVLEQYALACENQRLALHPRLLLGWIERVREEHGELR